MSKPTKPDLDDELARFSEFFGADELDPELEDYTFEDEDGRVWIKHPLVFSVFHQPMLNRFVNAQLASKQAIVTDYLAKHNWYGYIMVHERPYRMDALLDVMNDVTDAEWWEMVALVWIDSENIREYPDAWDFVLRQDRPERHAMMDDDEREAFAALPELIAVYQGCTVVRDDGWSWTTDRAKAIWFANRFADLEQSKPLLRTGEVNKSDVTAYFTRRNESEILVAPELVHLVKSRPVR